MYWLGMLLFFWGCVKLYWASEHWKFKTNGISGIATVLKIEEQEYENEDGDIFYYYLLHLKLPDYKGVPLGKTIETEMPQNYTVGESINIRIKKDAPTDILIEKEMKPMESHKTLLIKGLVLIGLSYFSCH